MKRTHKRSATPPETCRLHSSTLESPIITTRSATRISDEVKKGLGCESMNKITKMLGVGRQKFFVCEAIFLTQKDMSFLCANFWMVKNVYFNV